MFAGILLTIGIIFFVFVVLLIIFWKKTPFPEMLQHKREVSKLRNEIKQQAEMEAVETMKEDLVEKYKEKEIQKITQPKENPLKKISKGIRQEIKDLNPSEKLDRMMGTQQQPRQPQPQLRPKPTFQFQQAQNRFKGFQNNTPKKDYTTKKNEFEEKMKRIMG